MSNKIKAIIFDVDGTLLDSSAIWDDAGANYLKSIGVTPEANLGRKLFTMSLDEGANYMKEAYHLAQSCEEILDGVLRVVEGFYYHQAPLKAGVRELLLRCDQKGIPMVIASSSKREHIEKALQRLGVAPLFKEILTCNEVGIGKHSPDIFIQSANSIGSMPEETLVIEDGLYAMKTAKGAGFQVMGVYDEGSSGDWDEIVRTADFAVKSLDEEGLWQWIYPDNNERRTALTIAGSDSGGGAGIQADLKTMIANGVFGMSAITALTAQNTLGVTDILEPSGEFLKAQLDAVFTDIYPDAVKIGMVASGALIETIAERLQFYGAKNVVVDPVMVATSGAKLSSDEAVQVLCEKLLPLAKILTPNITEAEVFCNLAPGSIRNEEGMMEAAKDISEKYGCAVLMKGGHKVNDANDLLYKPDGTHSWFLGRRIDNPNTHGTGCTLSSAIASNLAKGMKLEDAVEAAKQYVSGALAAMLDLGKGSGPMDHGFDLESRFSKRN